jgi:hypothetical protein
VLSKTAIFEGFFEGLVFYASLTILQVNCITDELKKTSKKSEKSLTNTDER